MAMVRVTRAPVGGMHWLGMLAAAGFLGVGFFFHKVIGDAWFAGFVLAGLVTGFLPYMLLDYLPGASSEQFCDDPLEATKYRQAMRRRKRHFAPGAVKDARFRMSEGDAVSCDSSSEEMARSMEAWDLAAAGVKGTGDIFADSRTMTSHD